MGVTRTESISGIVVDERYGRAANLADWTTKVMTPSDVEVVTGS